MSCHIQGTYTAGRAKCSNRRTTTRAPVSRRQPCDRTVRSAGSGFPERWRPACAFPPRHRGAADGPPACSGSGADDYLNARRSGFPTGSCRTRAAAAPTTTPERSPPRSGNPCPRRARPSRRGFAAPIGHRPFPPGHVRLGGRSKYSIDEPTTGEMDCLESVPPPRGQGLRGHRRPGARQRRRGRAGGRAAIDACVACDQ